MSDPSDETTKALFEQLGSSWTKLAALKKTPSKRVYCAFIDILGLRSALQKWAGALNVYFETMRQVLQQVAVYNVIVDSDTKGREGHLEDARKMEGQVKDAFKIVNRFFKKEDRATPVNILVLSDALVITAERLEDVLIVTARAYKLCLLNRIPLRGYVAYGRHLHVSLNQNHLVVSQALRDAYEGESKLAVYPRVLVDNVLVEKWAYRDPTMFVQDEDDRWFLNPFFESFTPVVAKKLFSFVRKALKTNQKNPRVLEKYCWLADFLNAYTLDLLRK